MKKRHNVCVCVLMKSQQGCPFWKSWLITQCSLLTPQSLGAVLSEYDQVARIHIPFLSYGLLALRPPPLQHPGFVESFTFRAEIPTDTYGLAHPDIFSDNAPILEFKIFSEVILVELPVVVHYLICNTSREVQMSHASGSILQGRPHPSGCSPKQACQSARFSQALAKHKGCTGKAV